MYCGESVLVSWSVRLWNSSHLVKHCSTHIQVLKLPQKSTIQFIWINLFYNPCHIKWPIQPPIHALIDISPDPWPLYGDTWLRKWPTIGTKWLIFDRYHENRPTTVKHNPILYSFNFLLILRTVFHIIHTRTSLHGDKTFPVTFEHKNIFWRSIPWHKKI